VATEIAQVLGAGDNHALNKVIYLIGKERGIPGYKYAILDPAICEMDNLSKRAYLNFFDNRMSVIPPFRFFCQKINGIRPGEFILHREINECLATPFNRPIQVVGETIFNADYTAVSELSILAVWELADILKFGNFSAMRTLEATFSDRS